MKIRKIHIDSGGQRLARLTSTTDCQDHECLATDRVLQIDLVSGTPPIDIRILSDPV